MLRLSSGMSKKFFVRHGLKLVNFFIELGLQVANSNIQVRKAAPSFGGGFVREDIHKGEDVLEIGGEAHFFGLFAQS